MLNLRRRRRRPALTIPQFGSGVMGRVDASQRDRVMWSISSEDIERAKERLRRRRGEIEARYAEELQALDTELEAIAALERVAVDFASKNGREDLSPEVDPEPPIAAAGGGDPPGLAPADRRESGPGSGSRWRLHLGG
jgi:hypothetical protein